MWRPSPEFIFESLSDDCYHNKNVLIWTGYISTSVWFGIYPEEKFDILKGIYIDIPDLKGFEMWNEIFVWKFWFKYNGE